MKILSILKPFLPISCHIIRGNSKIRYSSLQHTYLAPFTRYTDKIIRHLTLAYLPLPWCTVDADADATETDRQTDRQILTEAKLS